MDNAEAGRGRHAISHPPGGAVEIGAASPLREQQGASADRWLREAIRLLEGTKGLAAFARKEGKAHPRAYLDWLTALQSEGKTAQVVAAAREALRALPADRPIRAAIADHLCEAARTLGDPETLQEGRWEAFTVKPSLGRLLDLWEATPESKRRTRMRQAERHLDQSLQRQTRRSVEEFDATVDDDLETPAWVDRTLLAHARMLCGDWEAARAMAADADVLGWSSSDNPQGVVSDLVQVPSQRLVEPDGDVGRGFLPADRVEEFRCRSIFSQEFRCQEFRCPGIPVSGIPVSECQEFRAG